MVQMQRALELDPLNTLLQALYGMVLLDGARRPDDAIEQFRNVLRTVPNHPIALACLVEAFYAKGMYGETYEAAKSNWTASGHPEAVEALERGYSEAGFTGAMSRLAEWRVARLGRKGFAPVFNYIAAGKNQQALDCLERAFEEHIADDAIVVFQVYSQIR